MVSAPSCIEGGHTVPAAEPAAFAELVYVLRLRSEEDRMRLRGMYAEVMPAPLPEAANPAFFVTDSWVQVGYATVRRRLTLPRPRACRTELLQRLLTPLQALLKCVEMGWLAIVVGPAASSKTSLVRLGAELTGNVLHEFSMNSSVDTTELLGGFEQVDLARHVQRVVRRFSRLVDTVSGGILCRCFSAGRPDEKLVRIALDIHASWESCISRSRLSDAATSAPTSTSPAPGRSLDQAQRESLAAVLRTIESAVASGAISLDGLPPECHPQRLVQSLAELADAEGRSASGRFEWIDGLLIQAMEAGDWLLIDNVNFCNPTVLDRLNALLEPGGVLCVNERGMGADGQIKSIRPHKDFRLFFAMDPRNGEISRAMRNRGVEIFLLEHDVRSRDTLALLNSCGVPGGDIPRDMAEFHAAARKALPASHQLTLREILQWARLAVDQANRGVPAIRALFEAMEQVYIRPCGLGRESAILADLFVQHFGKWVTGPYQPSLREAGLFPVRADGDLWRSDPAAAMLAIHSAVPTLFLRTSAEEAARWPALAPPSDLFDMFVGGPRPFESACTPVALRPDPEAAVALELSLLGFAETATFQDAHSRASWLSTIPRGPGGMFTEAIEAAGTALAALCSSPLQRSCAESLSGISSSLGINAALASTQPLSSEANRSFRSLVARLSGPMVSAHDGLSRRIELFVSMAFHAHAEARVCEGARTALSVGLSRSSAIQRSFLFSQNAIFQESLQADWEAFAWPFLSALSEVLKEWVTTAPAPDRAADLAALSAVSALAVARAETWESIASPSLQQDEAVWRWGDLMKRLQKAAGELPRSDRLAHIGARLRTSLAALCAAPSRFWRAVRPMPFRKAASWAIYRELVALGERLQFKRFAELDPANAERLTNKTLRQTLLEAAANFRWNRTFTEGTGTIQEVIALIKEKLPSKMIAIEATASDEDEDGDHVGNSATPWRLHSDQASLCPIIDFASILSEQEALGIALRALRDPAGSDSPRKAFAAHQVLVDRAPGNFSRSPIDFVPHTLALWAHSRGGVVQHIPGLLAEATSSWQRRVWANSFEETLSKGCKAGGFSFACGSSRLFQGCKGAIAFALLAPWRKAPVKLASSKLRQVKSLQAYLAQEAAPLFTDRARADAAMLFASVGQVVRSFEDSFKPDAWAAVDSQLRKLEDGDRGFDFEAFATGLRATEDSSLSAIHDILCESIRLGGMTGHLFPGQAWIALGIAKLSLVIPTASDPTSKSALRLASVDRRTARLREEIRVREMSEGAFTGNRTNPRIARIFEEIAALEGLRAKLTEKAVERSNAASFQALRSEVLRASEVVLSVPRIKAIARAIETGERSALSQEELWQDTAARLLENLESNFSEYPDVVQPLSVAVYEVRHGLRMTAAFSAQAKSEEGTTEVRSAAIALSSYPRCFGDDELLVAMKSLVSAETLAAAKEAGLNVPWKLLAAALSIAHSFFSTVGRVPTAAALDALSAVFGAYVREWEKCEEARLATEMDSAKDFEQRIREITVDGSEFEAREEAKDIRKMFPNFSCHFEDLVPKSDAAIVAAEQEQAEQVAAATKKAPAKKKVDTGLRFPKEDVEFVRKVHRSIFVRAATSSVDMSDTLSRQYDAASTLVKLLKSPPVELDRSKTAIHVAISEDVCRRLEARAIMETTRPINVYKEGCLEEAVLAMEPLTELEGRVSALMRDWPDHAILQSLSAIARRVLLLPLTAPLMSFITGLELLLAQANKWEALASKQVSLVPETEPVARLVSRWRRLELKSWPVLLVNLEEQRAAKSGKWFFHLYNVLASHPPGSREGVVAAVKTISEFLQTSSLGEFATRLDLVGALSAQLEARESLCPTEPADSPRSLLCRSVAGTFRLFSQFLEPCREKIGKLRQPLERDLAEFIQLSKWEKMEYYILKGTAERSQKKLLRFSRAYERILSLPILDLLSVLPAPIAAKSTASEVGLAPACSLMERKSDEQDRVPAGTSCEVTVNGSPQSACSRLPRLVRKLEKLSCKTAFAAMTDESEPIGRAACVGAAESLAAHGAVLAAMGTKPADMSGKKLAFVQFGRTLVSLGMSPRLGAKHNVDTAGESLVASPSPSDALCRMFAALVHGGATASRPESALWQLGSAASREADNIFPGVVARLQHFRKLRLKPSRDLQSREVELIWGFAEHFASLAIVQRTSLAGAAAAVTACLPACTAFSGLGFAPLPRQSALAESSRALSTCSIKIASCIDDAKRLLSTCHTDAASCLTELTALVSAQRITDEPLFTPRREADISDAIERIRSACALLAETASSSKVVFTPIQELCSSVASRLSPPASAISPAAAVSVSDFGRDFNAAVDSVISHILVSSQELKAACEKPRNPKQGPEPTAAAGSESEQQQQEITLLGCHELYTECLKCSSSDALSRKLNSLCRCVAALCDGVSGGEDRASALSTASWVLGRLHPLLHQFLHVSAMSAALASAFHVAFLRLYHGVLGTFSAIYDKGYNMARVDESESKEGEAEMADGTGMGEGEGQKDVSDQIESADQLDTADQKPPEEQKPPKPEDKDKGFDMKDTDFAGELEDVPQKPEEEEEKGEDEEKEEEEEEEKEEEEKQMGELDDDKAEQVDRQFWDGPEDEEQDLREELEEGEAEQPTDGNEMMAKEEKEEEGDGEDGKKKKKKKKTPQPPPKPQQPQDGDEKEEEGEDEGKKDGEQEEAEKVDGEEQGEFIDEEKEREKKDKADMAPEVPPEDDKLPDELELDEESGSEEGSEEEEGDEEGDEEEEEEEGEGEGEDDEELAPETEPRDEGDEGDMPPVEHPEAETGPEPKEEEQMAERMEQPQGPEQDQPHREEDKVFGVQDKKGAASESAAEMAEELQGKPENEEEEDSGEKRDKQRAAAAARSEKGEFEEAAAEKTDSAPQAEMPKPQPQPYKMPSEALRKWKKRLAVVDAEIEKMQRDRKEKGREDGDDEDEASQEADQYARTEADDERKETESTLAPVVESEAMEMPDEAMPQEEEPPTPPEAKADEKVKPEDMEVDDEEKGTETEKRRQQPRKLRAAVDEDEVDEEGEKKKKEEEQGEKEEEKKEETAPAAKENLVGAGAAPVTDMELVRTQLEEYYEEKQKEVIDLDEDVAGGGSAAMALWAKCQASVSRLSEELCEQLRIILEPTLTTQLKGDYRTGKRINMKKIIPYIASQFKKDKIWLRRTRPHKRHYQVMLAIDDSESMRHNHAGGTALEALALIAGALSRLEVGDIGVLRFGAEPAVAHDFSSTFTDADGARVVSQFTFAQKATDVAKLSKAVVQLLEGQKSKGPSSGAAGAAVEYQQVVFIISDGRFGDRTGLKQWIHEAESRRMLLVFIIVDDPTERNSILELRTVSYPAGKLTVTPYIDTFPFPFYVILRSISTLPDTIASALRQWFELLKTQS